MSNYNKIREVIRRMSGQDNIITIPKIYIEFAGDLTTAALLNQLVFYSDKGKRKDGFFYKTYKEWEEETGLTKRQVSYSIKKLKDMDLVETKLKKANGAPTIHYRLDYDKLLQSIITKCHFPLEQNVTIDSDNMSQSLTENTTEITTEITTSNTMSDSSNQTTIPYKEIIDYLNLICNTKYRAGTKKTQTLIKARWNEGFRVDDFKEVIEKKSSQWINNTDMQKFLRPETLFGTKFEGYLNEIVNIPKPNNQRSSTGGITW